MLQLSGFLFRESILPDDRSEQIIPDACWVPPSAVL